jgi:ATPase subunit of ABC transporter with duplicated ATPase domains
VGAILLPQTVEHLTTPISRFAEAQDDEAFRLFGKLGLDRGDLARWPTLSPGERKRWQVGAALWSDPAVLMLDEPTDHLDSEAREYQAQHERVKREHQRLQRLLADKRRIAQ